MSGYKRERIAKLTSILAPPYPLNDDILQYIKLLFFFVLSGVHQSFRGQQQFAAYVHQLCERGRNNDRWSPIHSKHQQQPSSPTPAAGHH